MKKYKLLQWYPSLDEEWDTTHRYEYQSSTGYMCNKSIQHCVIIYKKELHSDFWEEIEEPLFITEDGVEIFEGDEYIAIGINYDFRKVDTVAHDQVYSGDVMRFKYESNADEYIVKNKPVFSYEDFIRWGNVPYERVIEQLAKERIEQ